MLGAWLGAVPIPLDWYVGGVLCCSLSFFEGGKGVKVAFVVAFALESWLPSGTDKQRVGKWIQADDTS